MWPSLASIKPFSFVHMGCVSCGVHTWLCVHAPFLIHVEARVRHQVLSSIILHVTALRQGLSQSKKLSLWMRLANLVSLLQTCSWHNELYLQAMSQEKKKKKRFLFKIAFERYLVVATRKGYYTCLFAALSVRIKGGSNCSNPQPTHRWANMAQTHTETFNL